MVAELAPPLAGVEARLPHRIELGGDPSVVGAWLGRCAFVARELGLGALADGLIAWGGRVYAFYRLGAR